MSLIDRIARSLAAEPPHDLLPGDILEDEEGEPSPAAVLVAITDRPQPGLILTTRRDDLRTHAGQVAFPGGRIDAGETPVQAALREAHEELGLDPAEVEIIGELEDYRTITGYVVTPVLGVIPPDLRLAPHEHEVADWFEAPLNYLVDPANRQLETAVFAGRERRYWLIEWRNKRIWGATAAMLVNLSRRLQWT